MSRTDSPPTRPLDLGDGVSAFFGGIAFILTTPRVWGYALVPLTILLLLSCGLGASGFWGAARAATALEAWWSGTLAPTPDNADGELPDTASSPGGWARARWWTITLGLGLTLLILATVLALVLAQPLSGWALESIARAQERALVGSCSPEPSFLWSLWIACRVSLFTALVGGLVLAILGLISFFFPPAALVTVPLKFFVVSWVLAWNFVDYPLGLRGLGIRQRFVWAWQHFTAFTVFGVAWALVLIVPGMVLLVLPMGVAGATRLVVAAESPADELSW